jgi:GntR family transcriptional regulator, carbon starvation induced regulator
MYRPASSIVATVTAAAPTTRSQWAEDRLREAILTGELEPGERINASDLAEQWSVSVTPLREAIQRLAGDGLVEVLPQRGARVTAPSLAEVSQIYELRLLLEPLALRQSLEASDDQHRAEIRAAFTAFRAATDPLDAVEAHSRFHATLLSRCPSEWLIRFTTQLADSSRLYQAASLRVGKQRRHAYAEHKALQDAALSGDVGAAVELQVAHLTRTFDLVSTLQSTNAATE